MKKQTVEFAVKKENGVVNEIGKSYIYTPEIKFAGGSVNWFDDTKLLRKS